MWNGDLLESCHANECKLVQGKGFKHIMKQILRFETYHEADY